MEVSADACEFSTSLIADFKMLLKSPAFDAAEAADVGAIGLRVDAREAMDEMDMRKLSGRDQLTSGSCL